MELRILEVKHFCLQQSGITTRVTKDYEIDFELENGRVYTYNGVKRILKKGDILFRIPGSVVVASSKQNTYILTLDFSDHVLTENYSRNLPGLTQVLCDNPLIDRLEPVFHPENPEQFLMIYDELLKLPTIDSPAGQELVMELLYRLNAEICHKNYECIKPKSNVCHIVMDYMQKNLHKEITLENLAELVLFFYQRI